MRVLVYCERFLSRSMTFVYNQLVEARQQIRVDAAASSREHQDLFPLPNIHLAPIGRNLAERFRGVVRRSGLSYPLNNPAFERGMERIGLSQFDLVHAHFGPAGIRLYPVINRNDIPLLVTMHGSDASRMLRNRGYVRQLRSLFSDSRVWGITVSNTMRETLKQHGIPVDRIRTHYIGADTEFFSPSLRRRDVKTFTLLQVSNFVPKKGHRYAISAIELACRRNPVLRDALRVVFAGDGPVRAAVQATVEDHGLRDMIEFVGPVDKIGVRELMARADGFLHASITAEDGDQEGIPTVLMEAMAMGLPIVSTWHSGIPELVRDGIDGLLVNERDVSALASAIQELASQSPRFDGSSSRQRVLDEFNLARQSRALVEIYRSIGRAGAR